MTRKSGWAITSPNNCCQTVQQYANDILVDNYELAVCTFCTILFSS